MRGTRWLSGALFLLGCSTVPVFGQQIGKFVPIQAGSEVDHALTEINAATDPDQKLALINKFTEGPGKEGDYPLLADGLYFVGLDVIGGLLTEVNVTSPTGIQEIDRLDGVCLEARVLDFVEQRAATLDRRTAAH